jgi:hypothetical protein
MTVALIQTNPPTIIAVYDAVPNPLRPPGADPVSGAQVGWSKQGFALVAVAPFVPPNGQVITGNPSYSIDANGNVTQTYATIPTPAPVVSSLAFRQLFTPGEEIAITTAAFGNAQLRVFLDDASAAGSVDLGSAEVTQGIAMLVSAGLLTQARANLVLAGTPPT